MTRLRVAPSTVLAIIAILGVGICDPCDPCDDGSTRANAAMVCPDTPVISERGVTASD